MKSKACKLCTMSIVLVVSSKLSNSASHCSSSHPHFHLMSVKEMVSKVVVFIFCHGQVLVRIIVQSPLRSAGKFRESANGVPFVCGAAGWLTVEAVICVTGLRYHRSGCCGRDTRKLPSYSMKRVPHRVKRGGAGDGRRREGPREGHKAKVVNARRINDGQRSGGGWAVSYRDEIGPASS